MNLTKGQRIIVGYLVVGTTVNVMAWVAKGLGWW